MIETMKKTLKELETLARYENPETKIQVRKPKDGGPIVTMYPHKVATDAANVLRTAIAEAEKQEPVAWQGVHDTTDLYWRKPVQGDVRPLYTTPPAAQRQPLTNEQIKAIVHSTVEGVTVSESVLFRSVARAIEAAHGIGEKNDF